MSFKQKEFPRKSFMRFIERAYNDLNFSIVRVFQEFDVKYRVKVLRFGDYTMA